ncbi:MAG: hypothetical protein ABJF23_19180 [Bryobacteraceae bacterium]
MNLKQVSRYSSVFLLMFAASAFAAPKLRLSTTAVGPVVVAPGGSTSAAAVDYTNAGDGSLNLTAKSSVTWLNPIVSGGKINLNVQAGTLTRGSYTGLVTVSDPNAVDAPQTISVTIQVGTAIPDKVDLYVAPNGSSDSIDFVAGSKLNAAITTQNNLAFLSLPGSGSFAFNVPYQIVGKHLPGMAEGNYTGTIVTSNSTFAPDNKSTPVTLHVTSQPIARLTPSGLVSYRIAQGGPKTTQYVSIANGGQGTLSITAATATTTTGGNWLSAATPAGFSGISLDFDPSVITAPGTYQGSVAVTTNAANGPITVPVQFEVFAAGTPISYYGGAVNNAAAEAGDVLAQGTIVALFGEQFTLGAPQQGTLPLTTDLAGTKVFVNDQPAPLFYSSYNQINFQVPYNAATGPGLIRVERPGQRGNSISVTIAARAPRILKLGIDRYGIIVNEDGSFPIPTTPGISSHPAKAGDVLVIYAIGLGQTSPPVVEGASAPTSPLATVPTITNVLFGGGGFAGESIAVPPMFAGLTPGYAGLYQVNVTVPAGLPPGETRLILQGSDGTLSQISYISVQ